MGSHNLKPCWKAGSDKRNRSSTCRHNIPKRRLLHVVSSLQHLLDHVQEGTRNGIKPAEPNRTEPIIPEPAGTGHGAEPNRTEPRRVRKTQAEPRLIRKVKFPNRSEPNRATTRPKTLAEPRLTRKVKFPNRTEPNRIQPNRFLPACCSTVWEVAQEVVRKHPSSLGCLCWNVWCAETELRPYDLAHGWFEASSYQLSRLLGIGRLRVRRRACEHLCGLLSTSRVNEDTIAFICRYSFGRFQTGSGQTGPSQKYHDSRIYIYIYI